MLPKYNAIALMLFVLAFGCYNSVHAAKLTTKATNLSNTEVATTFAEVANSSTLSSPVGEAVSESVAAEQKTALEPTNELASLNVWSTVHELWTSLADTFSETLLGHNEREISASTEGRTFGKIRRLQMALIPIIFKFGLLTAMVAFLVLLGVKTLFLLKVLILMNTVIILGKFLTLKTNFAPIEHAAPVAYGYNAAYSPQAVHGWAPTAPEVQQPNKEIHLHIHGAQGQPQPQAPTYSTYGALPQAQHGWERRSDPYSAYEPLPSKQTDMENDINMIGPISLLPTSYPANHRRY